MLACHFPSLKIFAHITLCNVDAIFTHKRLTYHNKCSITIVRYSLFFAQYLIKAWQMYYNNNAVGFYCPV